MKLIIDCGSTKASVAVIVTTGEESVFDLSHGYNAISGADGELSAMITESGRFAETAGAVDEVNFYGAGCATPASCSRVRAELSSVFRNAGVFVATDMLGAARAVCGHSPGIVGILGTGSNSCLYDGERIVSNVSPLGYILGDEGSGAVLGRLFLGMILKGQFPDTLRERFERRYNLTAADIITRVYREPRPNAFLASFAPFIAESADIPEVRNFLTGEFSRYVRYNLVRYSGFGELPVHFVGSIAVNFRPYLEEALTKEGGRLGSVIKAPIYHLVEYHR